MKALWHKRTAALPPAAPKAKSPTAARVQPDVFAPQTAIDTAVYPNPNSLPRLAPKALPQRRIIDMVQATSLANEAAYDNRDAEAARRLESVCQSYPSHPGPFVRLVALGQATQQPHLAAQCTFGRMCPAPADQALQWLTLYADRARAPSHKAYRCSLPSILHRFADVLDTRERRALLARAQTPHTPVGKTLLERTLYAEPYGDAAGLDALLAFCPDFWREMPASLDDALAQALGLGAKHVYAALLRSGAKPYDPLQLALTALRDSNMEVFCAALDNAPELCKTPFVLHSGDVLPVCMSQAVLSLSGADAAPFIHALHMRDTTVLIYPVQSACLPSWRLAMQLKGAVMRSFIDACSHIDAIDAQTDNTLLMDAARYDYPWAVSMLLSLGANAALTHPHTGQTALGMAQSSGHTRTAALLMQPTRTRQLLCGLLVDADTETQIELIAIVCAGQGPIHNARHEAMRQLYAQHKSKYGAELSCQLFACTQKATAAQILDCTSIAVLAPTASAAGLMLMAIQTHLKLTDVAALLRRMQAHRRNYQAFGGAMYEALRCVIEQYPKACVDLLDNVRQFDLRHASDYEMSLVLRGFLAVAQQPEGMAAWRKADIERCSEAGISGSYRARRIAASLAHVFAEQEALHKGVCDAAPPTPASARWRRVFTNWHRSNIAGDAKAASADDDAALRQKAVHTLTHACTVASAMGAIFGPGPKKVALADIEQVARACHDDNVVDFFDDAQVAQRLVALFAALLGERVLSQVFHAQKVVRPDAKVLRRLFLNVHPDRAPTFEDKPCYDAMTALLGYIYTWLKDAAAAPDTALQPLVAAYTKRAAGKIAPLQQDARRV